jgi:hypothetical protein
MAGSTETVEQAVGVCRELFGTVTGSGDALWELEL